MKNLKFQYFFLVCFFFAGAIFFLSDDSGQANSEQKKEFTKRETRKLKRKLANVVQSSQKSEQIEATSGHVLRRPKMFFRRNSKKVLLGKKKKLISSQKASSLKGFDYLFLENYFAVEDNPENRKLYPDAKLKLNHLVVKGSYTPSSIPVVQNKDTGFIGIFTSVVIIKGFDRSFQNSLEESLRALPYSYRKSFDHLNLYHLQFENKEETLEAYKILKEKTFTKRISLEVLEYERRAI